MYFVYIIKSLKTQDKIYVGYTLNVQLRVEKHNEGGSIYTAEHRPWELIYYCAFKTKSKALAFEKYLKSHSGRAFTEKRLS